MQKSSSGSAGNTSERPTHHIYRKPGNPYNISLPIHNNKQFKLGLQVSQMRIAGITEKDL